MKRDTLSLVFAGLLSLAGPATARAGLVTQITSPFSGTITDYTTVTTPGTELRLPFTDSFGRTVDTPGGLINSRGLLVVPPGSLQFAVTFTGLATGTTQAGITMTSFMGSEWLTSVTFDNGDSFSVPNPINSSFVGFSDTTPFTGITFNFTVPSLDSSFQITDFRTAAGVVAVPEPSTLNSVLTGGVIAACAAAASWWRRARRGVRDR